MLGCDPEFTIEQNGRLVRASTALGQMDNITHEDWGPSIGDDCGSLELRPPPTEKSREMITRIRGMLVDLNMQTNGMYVARAGSYYRGRPLGGHIHVSRDMLSPDIEKDSNMVTVYVALPMSLIEVPKEKFFREDYGYGRPFNYRYQPHGVEFRTFPSWLVSPLWTRRVFDLTRQILEDKPKVLSDDFTKLITGWSGGLARYNTISVRNESFRAVCGRVFEDTVIPYWNRLMSEDRIMARLLGPWREMILRGRYWEPQHDMLTAWRVYDPVYSSNVVMDRRVNSTVKQGVRAAAAQVGDVELPTQVKIKPGKSNEILIGKPNRQGISVFIGPRVEISEAARVTERLLKGELTNV